MKAILFLALLGVALSSDYLTFKILGLFDQKGCSVEDKYWYFYIKIEPTTVEGKVEFELPFDYPDYAKATCYISGGEGGESVTDYIMCVSQLLLHMTILNSMVGITLLVR